MLVEDFDTWLSTVGIEKEKTELERAEDWNID